MPTAGSVSGMSALPMLEDILRLKTIGVSTLIDKSFYYLGENLKLTLNPFKALVALYQAGSQHLFFVWAF